MKFLSKKFKSLVLTSGTISPLEISAKILGLDEAMTISVKPQWLRDSLMPLVVTKADDQSLITSAFSERGNT